MSVAHVMWSMVFIYTVLVVFALRLLEIKYRPFSRYKYMSSWIAPFLSSVVLVVCFLVVDFTADPFIIVAFFVLLFFSMATSFSASLLFNVFFRLIAGVPIDDLSQHVADVSQDDTSESFFPGVSASDFVLKNTECAKPSQSISEDSLVSLNVNHHGADNKFLSDEINRRIFNGAIICFLLASLVLIGLLILMIKIV